VGLGSQRCLVRSRVAGGYLFAAYSILGCLLHGPFSGTVGGQEVAVELRVLLG
jgi:hypothetical protein